MSEEILTYARARNVSKIVIGKPVRSLWKRMLFGSIADSLVRGSGDIDIYVVSGDKEAPVSRPHRERLEPSNAPAYAEALGIVALCTKRSASSPSARRWPGACSRTWGCRT